ncbi:zinc-dependent metalloprotease family protein [Yersinia massiliensis]|uniref:Metalloprotease StcE beta-sandwich domain-containing protein n=2 Tax=Yersinia massiliensis TaxID=419257 RepID=A0ABM6UQ89_9GAMM|nr:zinc-dependent metalloprotease family protein [Yersinia massiliensis]AVX37038.1 hypothetical protein DA391_04815 [Yersinia massiliensis]QKJ11843.1 hypothetical protein HRD68_14530 [Yersinia massiliensis]
MKDYTLFTSPNELGSNVLPSGYDEVIFELSDGNWINNIILPEYPEDKCSVVIRTSATWDAVLQLPLVAPVEIKTGNQYTLEYDADIQQWNIKASSIQYLSPNSVGNVIPDNPQNMNYYSMNNCNYATEVTLPAIARNGDTILIRSTACEKSKVSADTILYSGETVIEHGEQYVFKYYSSCNMSGWIRDSVNLEFFDDTNNEILNLTKNISIDSNKIPKYTLEGSLSDINGEISDSIEHTRVFDENGDTIHEKVKERSKRSISNKLSTTPDQLGSGILPSGYDDIVFELYDGNWTKDVILPLQPVDGTRVVIKSTATFDADLHLPFTKLKITSDSEYTLEYHEDIQQWDIQGQGVTHLTPNSDGSLISENLQGIVYYKMENNDWVPEITLPSTAKDESLVIIRSTASNNSSILANQLLYASTTTIEPGDQYVLKYLKSHNLWVVDSSPIRNAEVDSLNGEIPSPTSQKTLVTLTDNLGREKVILPENAGDRDKIILKSLTDNVTFIDASNVNNPSVMKLHHGEQYEFFYLAEKGKWQLIDSPDTFYEAQDIIDGKIPELQTPRTVINSANGNYQPNLYLPTAQEPGSRVIINSEAELDISVSADNSNYKISKGETAAFKVDERGHWDRETVTIDLLLLYSDKAADRLGEDAMHKRLTEGFILTNEALENSGANFRYRIVGLRQVEAKVHWKSLGNPLEELREDATVQGWRNTLKADGIYYEGTEDGCGLAWLGSWGRDRNMVATGSINCGTTVMRHELGHNMGLSHGGESESHDQGYGLLSTIMAGNAVPYYSTPDRYTMDYGIPMGIPNKIDAVQAMNSLSSKVSAYR